MVRTSCAWLVLSLGLAVDAQLAFDSVDGQDAGRPSAITSPRPKAIDFTSAGSLSADVASLTFTDVTEVPSTNGSSGANASSSAFASPFSVLPPTSSVDLAGFPFLSDNLTALNASIPLKPADLLRQESDEWIRKICRGHQQAACRRALAPHHRRLEDARDEFDIIKTTQVFAGSMIFETITEVITNCITNAAMLGLGNALTVGALVDTVTIDTQTWRAQCKGCTGAFVSQMLQTGGSDAVLAMGGYVAGGECSNALADGDGSESGAFGQLPARAPVSAMRLGFPDIEDEHKSDDYHTSGSGDVAVSEEVATAMKVSAVGGKTLAVFQSVMLEAGISFVNQVPAFVRRDPALAGLAPPTIQTQLFEARWAIAAMVARFEELRQFPPQPQVTPEPSPATAAPRPVYTQHEFDIYAPRKASSILKYKYLAKAGGWTESEKCDNLRMYLTKSARVWYKQLGVKFGVHRLTWKKLAAAFKDEFLDSGEPAFEKYCYLSQSKSETARQYLWRLNVAAKEAGIPLQGPVAVERHVTRFVSSLRDSPVRTFLIGATFGSIEELETQLRLYERRSRPGREDTGHRDRSASRSRDAATYVVQQRSESVESSDEEDAGEDPRMVRFQVDDGTTAH
ncbi:hypothetical protein P43SY_009118 [Pythium insidiosum]|uniref:Retrotransposon gag domain-containing protein n=1 Tax=Pythium insidiosum TaxID=114742 RepID=A0AAD5LSB0_PYTIN|nr:hypothetical protein P43SY_009118 [Pythium insidiosum]